MLCFQHMNILSVDFEPRELLVLLIVVIVAVSVDKVVNRNSINLLLSLCGKAVRIGLILEEGLSFLRKPNIQMTLCGRVVISVVEFCPSIISGVNAC